MPVMNGNTVYLVAAAAVLLWAGCATHEPQTVDLDPQPVLEGAGANEPPGADVGDEEQEPFTCCPVPKEARLASPHNNADKGCWENADTLRSDTSVIDIGEENVTGLDLPKPVISILKNNAWVRLDTGEYCVEEGGKVMIGTLIEPGPIRDNYKE